MSIMDEEAYLRRHAKHLEAEKTRRVDNFAKLASVEAELCAKLKMSKTQLIKSIPSEVDISNIASRVKELEKEHAQRMDKMCELKQEIMSLSEDLDLSHTDSFAEEIIFEEVEKISLGDQDLERAGEFLTELKQKMKQADTEISSLRAKIKELWEKLKIDNLNMKDIVQGTVCSYNDGTNNKVPKSKFHMDF